MDPNEPGHKECMIFSTDGRTRLLFIEVPEDKQVKNRLHFDLRPTDATRDQEVARLLTLGATEVADHRRADGSGWVTLADPESNEFDVLRGESESTDPYAHLIT
jgi:Glyoxalase-like domain